MSEIIQRDPQGGIENHEEKIAMTKGGKTPNGPYKQPKGTYQDETDGTESHEPEVNTPFEPGMSGKTEVKSGINMEQGTKGTEPK